MTDAEFEARNKLIIPDDEEVVEPAQSIAETASDGNRRRLNAASINWVSAGKVSSVKDQGACAGCYAFSAAAAMESAYAIKYNTSPADYSA